MINQYDGVPVVTPADFDFSIITEAKKLARPRGNQSTRNVTYFKDLITAFDIETTRLDDPEQAIMYIWQWCFGDKCVVIGRTWDEFLDFCMKLREALQDLWLCVYVHNLSHEFCYLKGVYKFDNSEVFAMERRKVLKCTMYGCLEFRCSYIHSNMRLETYTSKMMVKHQKLAGELDYNVKRYPWTELTEQELAYCINDVLGLVEAITTEMQHDNDTLYTIPLTSTGYVRRDAKKAMRNVSHFFVLDQLPDYYLYLMLREAFRGGNTHAHRLWSGKVLSNVGSVDESSAYPFQECCRPLPIGPFFHTGQSTLDDVLHMINVRGKAVIMRIAFVDIKLADKFWGCPYLSRDKCRNIIGGIYDNGRILQADYLETTITDIDLKIIVDEYVFSRVDPFDVAHARYGTLPRPLINCTIRYFQDKTSLKGVDGQELLYTKSKNKLNSIYGMMAQDPVKASIYYTGADFIPRDSEHIDELALFGVAPENPITLLEKHNKTAFLCYQWGVWITAWARWSLEEGIKLAGDNFVYCDTDSIKYLGDLDLTNINRTREELSRKVGTYATDPAGVTHYMGVFEDEGRYDKFATLGAKKYVFEKKGKLQITIAGVNKDKGADELGKIENFKPGFVFRNGGGTESVFNDSIDMTVDVDGHTLPITDNVYIRPSTYTLGITAEYQRLLEGAELLTDIIIF